MSNQPQRDNTPRSSFLHHPAVVITALLVFFPLGIGLMWHGQVWSTQTRYVISGFFGLLIVAFLGTETPAPNGGASNEPPPPTLPADPLPPVADRRNEVPDLKAKLANDETYTRLWQAGTRKERDRFLTYVSELIAVGGAAARLSKALQRAKLKQAAINLYLIAVRDGHLPQEFVARVQNHISEGAQSPRSGLWSAKHDYTALAYWLNPTNAEYLRARLAAKGKAPGRWYSGESPPWLEYLATEQGALERLAVMVDLTDEELARLGDLKCRPKGLDIVTSYAPTTGKRSVTCKPPKQLKPKLNVGEFLTARGFYAARTRKKLERAMRLALSDPEAFAQLVATDPEVFRLGEGMVVVLVGSEGPFASTVKVRKKGTLAEFWTVNEALTQ